MVAVNPILREVAEANPAMGYWRIWAKASSRGYNKSASTAYRELRRGGLLLCHRSHAQFKEALVACKEYLKLGRGVKQ